jgi:hypothetical protein
MMGAVAGCQSYLTLRGLQPFFEQFNSCFPLRGVVAEQSNREIGFGQLKNRFISFEKPDAAEISLGTLQVVHHTLQMPELINLMPIINREDLSYDTSCE